MADISREEIDRLYTTMDQGFRGVHTRLDLSNGRLGKAETDIAVLKDRAERTATSGAVWGSGVGAAVAGLLEGLHWWLGK
jgi:hypothetical protein